MIGLVSDPADPSSVSTIASDHSRASTLVRNAATRSADIAEPLSADLCRFAGEHRLDRGQLLEAAFALLVFRYTGESPVILAAARPDETHITVDIDAADSFLDILARTSRAARSADADAAVGYDACFDAASDAHAEAVARFDVALAAFVRDDALTLRWTYDADRFERSAIKRFGMHFQHLLEAAIAEPNAPVTALPMMGDRERANTIALGRGAVNAYERNETVHELFARQAERTPDAIAVRDATSALTYAELHARSNRLAHYLRSLGVGPRASVGVALSRSAEVPVVLLGILKAGAAYVPLDLSYPLQRLRSMIEDANVGLVVSDAESASRLSEFGTAAVAIDRDRELVAVQSTRMPDGGTSATSRAYVMYTSGSTGRAKGVAIPHRAIARLVRNTDFVDIAPDDVYLQYAPLAFDASTLELWAPLLNGGTVAFPRPGLLSLDELGAAIEHFGVTTLWLTAGLFREAVDARLGAFASLRRLLTGGDVVSPLHAKRFRESYPSVALINGYGPTENTTFSCCWTVPSAEAIGARLPIGRPIANSTAYVVDERLQPVAVGVPGELCVGGDGVALGYLHVEDASAERFVRDPFADVADARLYRTGDRVRWRADGLLEFLGRVDRQVKIRGFRVELDDIETSLLGCAGVADAAVVVAQTASAKMAVAFVVPASGARIDDGTLRAELGAVLPAYMLPGRIVVVSALPTHPSGKVDRVALVRTAEAETSPPPPAAAGTGAPPRRNGNLQAAIADIWRDVLKTETTLGPDTNFFDAGGDSLLLLTLHVKLSEKLAVRVGVMDLFEHTTIRKLAAYISGNAR